MFQFCGILYVKWDEVVNIFEKDFEKYEQTVKEIPGEDLDLLYKYLKRCCMAFNGPYFGGEAKVSHFIAPIIVCVCSLFQWEIEILTEYNMDGKIVRAHGHFEFILKRGRKRICIVEAKEIDLKQGITQNLIGCEVAAELDNLEEVYGIVTNYSEWIFFKSGDEIIMKEMTTLRHDDGLPNMESLAVITGKIYSMLSK